MLFAIFMSIFFVASTASRAGFPRCPSGLRVGVPSSLLGEKLDEKSAPRDGEKSGKFWGQSGTVLARPKRVSGDTVSH